MLMLNISSLPLFVISKYCIEHCTRWVYIIHCLWHKIYMMKKTKIVVSERLCAASRQRTRNREDVHHVCGVAKLLNQLIWWSDNVRPVWSDQIKIGRRRWEDEGGGRMHGPFALPQLPSLEGLIHCRAVTPDADFGCCELAAGEKWKKDLGAKVGWEAFWRRPSFWSLPASNLKRATWSASRHHPSDGKHFVSFASFAGVLCPLAVRALALVKCAGSSPFWPRSNLRLSRWSKCKHKVGWDRLDSLPTTILDLIRWRELIGLKPPSFNLISRSVE